MRGVKTVGLGYVRGELPARELVAFHPVLRPWAALTLVLEQRLCAPVDIWLFFVLWLK
jgi:hypothetical protein